MASDLDAAIDRVHELEEGQRRGAQASGGAVSRGKARNWASHRKGGGAEGLAQMENRYSPSPTKQSGSDVETWSDARLHGFVDSREAGHSRRDSLVETAKRLIRDSS